jgi:hypothetical protein
MIVASAVKRKSDGKVWVGKKHSDITRRIYSEGQVSHVAGPDFIMGFVNDTGVFFDRWEAYEVAVENRQIVRDPNPHNTPMLLSEDLW